MRAMNRRRRSALDRNHVEYLLIGGDAAGYYGYVRATADMEIRVTVSPDNVTRSGTPTLSQPARPAP